MSHFIKKKNIFCARRGMTLIEMIVVVALVGIMSSVTVVLMAGSRTDRALDAAAREVAALVREVQNYALTGRQVSDVNVACLYGMKAVNATQYQVFYQYREADKTCTDALSDDTEYFSRVLPHGVEFSDPAFSVQYALPHAALGGTPKITLSKAGSSGDRRAAVCLYGNGDVIVVPPSDNPVCP
jgi:prepilin-type N-terminal cleavage/methylation domain-containing protein